MVDTKTKIATRLKCYVSRFFLWFLVVSLRLKGIRPRPHVSGDFCIRNFFYADTKISASTRSVYESYTTVHTYPIRIRTSQRVLKEF